MKGKKLIVSALVATMVGAPVAVLGASASALAENNTPLTNEDNSYTVVGPSVKVNNNYKKSARKGEEVTVPELVSTVTTGQGNNKLTVINPYGEVVTVSAAGKFVAEIEGVYTYRIECYDGTSVNEADRSSIVSTYELYLEVEGDSGVLEFPENSYHVVPTEFVKGKTLSVPVPTAFVNDEEVVFSGSDKVAVTDKDGNTTYAVVKALLYKSGSTTPIEMTFNASTGSKYDKQAFFSYGIANDDSAIGTYKLEYRLYNVTNENTNVLEKEDGVYKYKAIYISNKKTITVKSSLTSDKLYISWASQPRKSAEVGVEYNLVDVNATFTEGSTDYENVFTQITVKHQESGEEMAVDYDNMTFVPTKKGNYYVTYKAVIPSLGLSSNVLTYSITDVDDSTKPVLYLTGNYYIGEDGKTYADQAKTVVLDGMDRDELLYTIGDYSHYVKSYYKMKQVEGTSTYAVTVKIPAAYVTDNYSNIKNMTITRNLYKRANTTDSGKLELINSETSSAYAFNEVAEYTFSSETGKHGDGNYVVKYIYTDENGQSVTSDFNITVKSESETTVKGEPKVTFNYDEEMIEKDDIIKFDIPTATDEYDTNLLVKTYYGFSNEVDLDTDKTKLMEQLEDASKFTEFNYKDVESGDYKLDVKAKMGATSKTYLYLVTVAENNYDENYTLGKNVVVKKVLILGGIVDTDAPEYMNMYTTTTFNAALVEANVESGTLENTVTLNKEGFIDGQTTAAFDQDDIITIPSVSFKDKDKFMTFDVKVTYANGDEVVELNSLETDFSIKTEPSSGQYLYTLSDASFRASYAKTYTVTVSATDSNGNVTFTSFAVRVNDTQPPVIAIENKSKFSEDVEVGTTFIVPAPTVYDNDEIDEDANWEYSVLAPNASKPAGKGQLREFIPKVTGTYIFTYSVKDGAGNPNTSSEYRLNVVAKDAPIITVAPIEESDRPWDDDATTQPVFEIPKATAKDVNFSGNIVVGAPVVKNSKGTELKVTESSDKSMWQFTPDVQGTYTITYSAQGKFLSSTKELTVNVGDGEKPTLDWVNKNDDFKASLTTGETWTFKFDMITVEDNETDMASKIAEALANGVNSDAMVALKDYATISMKNSDNTEITPVYADGGLKYTFDKSGTYTFKIVLKDEAGNSTNNTYSYSINVTEKEEAEEKDNDSVVGTVLIVLSVVILAGVVAYFAITTKQVENKSKKAEKKSDKKANKKDEK